MTRKDVGELTIDDFAQHPVWQFVADETYGETIVEPYHDRPVTDMTGKVVGLKVLLANGSTVWATMDNIDLQSPRRNKQFMGIALENNGSWFFLARYFDVDYVERSPQWLANFLWLEPDEVFPISYDLRSVASGNIETLVGTIDKEPEERLTCEERSNLE